MYENKIGSIVIVKTSMNNNNSGHDIRSSDNTKNKQQRQPVGIITERDVVRILGSLQPALLKVPIRDLMSKPVITITPSRSIKDAMQTMQLKNIRRLVVVDDEKANDGKSNNKNKDDDNMVGIITYKDIFRAIMKNQNLIPSLLADELFSVHKTIYEQFSEYWFGDILHKR
jgi:CBS domain-containing protein